jgi:hypothetical protein
MDNTSEKQIKRVVLNRLERCSVCHHEFEPDDIRVVSRKDDMWMMVVTCTECHARNFVAAVFGGGDPAEAQLALRRLSEAPSGRDESPADGPQGHPVSVDDVLEMHQFLREFDGDFSRLFASN